MKPVPLPPNQIHHFDAGGAAIAAFRGTLATDDDAPEDWIGSTTTLFGQRRTGLSALAAGATRVPGAVHVLRCRPPAPEHAPPHAESDAAGSPTRGA